MINPNKPRNTKQTKGQIEATLQDITRQLQSHIGEYAVFLRKESRYMVPYFVLITNSVRSQGVLATQTFYDSEGKKCGSMGLIIDAIQIMTGEQQVSFFNEI